jgi:hypothetical protein
MISRLFKEGYNAYSGRNNYSSNNYIRNRIIESGTAYVLTVNLSIGLYSQLIAQVRLANLHVAPMAKLEPLLDWSEHLGLECSWDSIRHSSCCFTCYNWLGFASCI